MIKFDDRRCFICGSSDRVELHHIFGGTVSYTHLTLPTKSS